MYRILISIYNRNAQSLSEMLFHNVTVHYFANSKESVEEFDRFIETITNGSDDYFTSYDIDSLRVFVLHTKTPDMIMQKLDEYYEESEELSDKDIKMNANEETMSTLLPEWNFDPKASPISVCNTTIDVLHAVMPSINNK